MERPVGEFVRQIGLPQAVDKDAIKADIDGGVLRVLMPKIKSKK
jgi:HSP20 family molecular chaperone IbpA